MPKSKYDIIFKDIREKIESGEYEHSSFLPSENTMVKTFDCSRNTIRRAISHLVELGYVQPLHGKGVRVIYQPVMTTNYSIGGIESFAETAARNQLPTSTKVIRFTEIVVDDHLAKKTGFMPGAEAYYIQRVRYLDGKPLIFDTNLFLKEYVPGLTEEIAEQSVYAYIENVLHMQIVTSKRTMTVERVTEMDEKYLELNDYNCLAVVTGRIFNSDGFQFEYTQSRHRPDYFAFHNTAVRDF